MIAFALAVALAAQPSSPPAPKTLSEAVRTYGICMILAASKFDDGVTDVHIVLDAASPECESLVEPAWQAALREDPGTAQGHEREFKEGVRQSEGIRAILFARASRKK